MLYYLLTTLYVLVCLLLLLVILLQQGKGGDMASAFGGGSSQTAFGARGGATVLTKATTVLAVLFMIGALGLAIIGQRGPGSLVSGTAAPKAAPKAAPGAPAKMPVKSRYAVRVVTYSQPSLAQLELTRLQRRGETAFLVKQSDRTVLYVGPFPTRAHAAEKLAVLRRQYRDCFLQSL